MGADLRDVNFSEGNFTGATFEDARLERVLFVGATLDGANLRTNLTDAANFTGASLVNAQMGGMEGTGVIFAESKASVESMLETIWSLGEDIMIQRFIAESKGKDIRVLVINGEVRAAMRRIGAEGEFRSNIHRGGTGEPVKLTKVYERIAVRAASAAGLALAGVDILEASSGPMVIEVNASPGFEGLEEATKRNIAKMFVEAAVRAARGRK